MRTLTAVTTTHRKPIALLLASMLVLALVSFAGPAAALRPAAPESPEGYVSCPGGQCFEDVPESSPFYGYVNNLYEDGIVSGYTCGSTPAEPCMAPDNRPYYRPASAVTRAQMTKFVDLARNVPGTTNSAAPIAYAFINASGTVLSGTPNVSATYDADLKHYAITIAGETYLYYNYVAIVTAHNSSAPVIATTRSAEGKLLVFCHNVDGGPVACQFQLVVYKP